MPRRPRMIIPDVPIHVTQRGVDRGATFFADADYMFYRWALREASDQARCVVHAYAFMTNHVHMLLTPADRSGPATLMRTLGACYVSYFNRRYHRCGPLWEGRFRSSLINSERYFFACSRYIELNPVRAGLVAAPAAYRWSSFRHNAVGEDDPLVGMHPLYTSLGASRAEQASGYLALFEDEVDPADCAVIRYGQRVRPPLAPSTYRQLAAAVPGRRGAAPMRVIAEEGHS